MKKETKYIVSTAVVSLILIYFVFGNESVYSYLTAGLWLGFLIGTEFKNKI